MMRNEEQEQVDSNTSTTRTSVATSSMTLAAMVPITMTITTTTVPSNNNSNRSSSDPNNATTNNNTTNNKNMIHRKVWDAVERVRQGADTLAIGACPQPPLHRSSIEYLVYQGLLGECNDDGHVHSLILSHVQLGNPVVAPLLVDDNNDNDNNDEPAAAVASDEGHQPPPLGDDNNNNALDTPTADDTIHVLRPIVQYLQDPRCSLRTLHLVGSRLGNAAARQLLRALCHNTTVTDLDWNTNYLQDFLEEDNDHRHHDCGGCGCHKFLTHNQTLQHWNLSYNWLLESTAHRLAQSLTHHAQLLELNLNGCVLGNSGTRPILEHLTPLKRRSTTTAAAATPTTTTPKNTTTTIAHRGGCPLPHSIPVASNCHNYCSNLRILKLSLNSVTHALLSPALSNFLRYNPTLEQLDLSLNPSLFGAEREEEEEEGDGIHHNNDNNNAPDDDNNNNDDGSDIASTTIALQGVQAFAQALGQNTTLRSLYLNLCGLRHDTAYILFDQALSVNTTLQYLDISQNDLSRTSTALASHSRSTRSGSSSSSSNRYCWRTVFANMRGLRHLKLDSLSSLVETATTTTTSVVEEDVLLQGNFSLVQLSTVCQTNAESATAASSYVWLERNRVLHQAQEWIQRLQQPPQKQPVLRNYYYHDNDKKKKNQTNVLVQPKRTLRTVTPVPLHRQGWFLEQMARYPAPLHWILRNRILSCEWQWQYRR